MSSRPIFVSDNTLPNRLASPDDVLKKLIGYQLKRGDKHKIYLPPSVLKIFVESSKGETKAQVDNLFMSVISTGYFNYETTIIQELCLTADLLKDMEKKEAEKGVEIVLITENPEFHTADIVEVFKRAGFTAVVDFAKLEALLKELN